MLITQIQTRLRSILNEETKKRELVPSKVWQTLDEIDEDIFDVDVKHLFKHHISTAADQMRISEEECVKYFRIKKIEQEEHEDHYAQWK